MNRRSLTAAALGTLAAAAVLVASPGASWSQQVKLTLSGAQEVPPVKTSASGTGTIVVGDDKAVSGSVTTTGVVGVAAHIHQGAPGENGPVIIPLIKTGDKVWSVPGDAKLSAEQNAAFKDGNRYVNVHSAAN